MRYWARVRRNGESSTRIESDSIRELWYMAYRLARILRKDADSYSTFRINDTDAENYRKYRRIRLQANV